jgi:hypothetical protein
LVLLIGLVGGLAMGSLADARRTESSYSVFLAHTEPSNLALGTALYNPSLGFKTGYDAALVERISGLPHVKRAESYSDVYTVPIKANGQPTAAAERANMDVLGSVDGLFFNQDRVTVVQGRMANPKRANEVMMTVSAARELGLHVGQTVRWGTYADDQSNSSSGTPPLPAIRERLTLVATVVLNNAVVQDDIDANGPTTVILTPALAHRLVTCCANFSFTYLQLDHGGRYVGAVESEIERIVPSVLPYDFFASSVDVTKAQNAIRPEAIALAVFGLIAALAAILIAAQMIGRQMSFWNPEWRTLRVIGASPAMTASDGLLGIVGSVVLGSVLAGAVAVALSPLAPLGPVRPYYPSPGVAFDWTVLGVGIVGLIVVLGAVALAFALRRAPHRATTWRRRRVASRLAGSAASAGLPASAVLGVRFALEPGAESENVPVRSAILGAVLAVTILIATVVFGSSLNSLVSHPRLYGWNWNYAMMAGGGAGDIPAKQSATLLDHDASVAAWSGYYFGNLEINGLTVPVLGGSPRAAVVPPILSGHGLDAPDQIVLAPDTLSQIHKVLGDTVRVSYGATTVHHLVIVGTATMPAVGVGGLTGHPSLGTGALVPYQLLPAPVKSVQRLSPWSQRHLHSSQIRRGRARRAAFTRSHRGQGVDADELLQLRVRRATTGRDRQLPFDGFHAVVPRTGTHGGGGERLGPHADHVGPSPASVDGRAADPGFHGPPVGDQPGLAVERRRRHRTRARRAAGHSSRPLALGALRPRDLRRAQRDGGDSPDRGNRGRRTRAG